MKVRKLVIEELEDLVYEEQSLQGLSSISAVLLKNSKPVAPDFFAGVKTNPWRLIDTWSTEPCVRKFVRQNPQYKYRTVVDLLFSVGPSELKNYPEVEAIRTELLDIAHLLSNNFKEHMQRYILQDLNLSESQVRSLKDFIKLGTHKKIKIKEMLIEGDITEEQARRCYRSFQTISTLIPDKYKKNIPPLTLAIREKDDDSFALATTEDKENPLVVVYMREEIPLMMSEILHEYGHLIENYNPEVMRMTNDFLRERVLSPELMTIEAFSKKQQKAFSQSNKDEIIYPTDLMDPYMGKTYGDLMKKDCPTELLSTALQLLYVDPIKLFLRDPDCFKLVSSLLHGQI